VGGAGVVGGVGVVGGATVAGGITTVLGELLSEPPPQADSRAIKLMEANIKFLFLLNNALLHYSHSINYDSSLLSEIAEATNCRGY